MLHWNKINFKNVLDCQVGICHMNPVLFGVDAIFFLICDMHTHIQGKKGVEKVSLQFPDVLRTLLEMIWRLHTPFLVSPLRQHRAAKQWVRISQAMNDRLYEWWYWQLVGFPYKGRVKWVNPEQSLHDKSHHPVAQNLHVHFMPSFPTAVSKMMVSIEGEKKQW